jgi:hypothetical protein
MLLGDAKNVFFFGSETMYLFVWMPRNRFDGGSMRLAGFFELYEARYGNRLQNPL